MSIELVVFDMAGTTVRDKGNVASSFIKAFAENDIEVPISEVKKVMGFRKKDAIRILLDKHYISHTENLEELIEKIHDSFVRTIIGLYEQDEELTPLPFAEEIFQQLKDKGIKIALNTGFTHAIAETILKRLHWNENKNIDFVISSDEVPQGRPYPYMIHTIMDTLQVKDASKVVKIGDTEVDIEEGRNAGCGLVISVTTGAYTREQLEQYRPDVIIDSLAELRSILTHAIN
jgi:phosphonatase-like hydrolase